MKYRIPDIEEFVEGFEFEVLYEQTSGYAVLDLGNNAEPGEVSYWKKSYWEQRTVPSFSFGEVTIGNITVFNNPVVERESYLQTIKILLEDGKIRKRNY